MGQILERMSEGREKPILPPLPCQFEKSSYGFLIGFEEAPPSPLSLLPSLFRREAPVGWVRGRRAIERAGGAIRKGLCRR